MGVEKGFGIMAVVSIFIVEIVVHLGMFIGFHIPTWGWLLLYSPALGFGLSACISGLTVYCDNVLGALGFNILEGAFWFTADHTGAKYPGAPGAPAPANTAASFISAIAPAPSPSNAPHFSIQSYE